MNIKILDNHYYLKHKNYEKNICWGFKLCMFKARVDGALSNLVQRKVSLAMAGGLELNDL